MAEPLAPDQLDPIQLLAVLRAFRKGDFAARMPIDRAGVAGKIADELNAILELGDGLRGELLRVNVAVGKEGRIGERASLPGVRGGWAECVGAVNGLVEDLVQPTAEAARVLGGVAQGDLARRMSLDLDGRPLRGEFLRIATVVNAMVDQLSAFAGEVTRVAREVGIEGKLGGQAQVPGVSGTWKDLTDNVNLMASNLTGQVRNIAEVTKAVAGGDLSKKITVDVKGEILDLKNTINTMVDQLSSFAAEVTRVAREVGTEGKLGGQAMVQGVSGTWKDLTDNVNSMASNLTGQVRNIAGVTTAVARGDLSKKITVDVRGEIRELKDTINTMVDQLRSFASEVTRVAREVGTDGKLGGQADVQGVAGTWKDLTDSVNFMASNLTDQVRNIAGVATAVANGDLSKKITVAVRGEILELKDTINTMVDQLRSFASEVTRVAREVGTEGKLGGQAEVRDVAGTWRDLTDNVNQLAANLTTQVRAIADVTTAVTEGDLTRSITVSAQGEVAALKDKINQMIANLRATTRKNTDQDWLKTNLARFTRMLQGERDLETVSRLILKELAPLVKAQQGAFYVMDESADAGPVLRLLSSWAYRERKGLSHQFRPGEGLVGQCVLEKERILVTELPDDYLRIGSGLGEGLPRAVVVIPVLFEAEVKAVIELASFQVFNEIHLAFLDQLTESIGIVLNTIAAGMRTEELLKQSQSLAEELRSQQGELTASNRLLEQQARSLQASEERLKLQQEELQRSNEELEERSRLLQTQNVEVERKNREIEQAKVSLEERAQQLALSSKYKSEFLANMSHELRTPLNSLLILAKMLADDPGRNLDAQQVEFAHTIHAAGTDLLALINDILDLSKIESGSIQLEVDRCPVAALGDFVERSFRHMAEQKGLSFEIEVDRATPSALYTDARRLQQILKNLLSNAFKFTERGAVTLRVGPATSGWSWAHEALGQADAVVAFAISDTGIGIPADKQRTIFEAFQQADGSTARKYGGTGLGLSISRELASLLGGEITVASTPGQGSTFTLYVPRALLPAPARGPNVAAAEARPAVATAVSRVVAPRFDDDRETLKPGDRVLLVVGPDAVHAALMMGLAHERGLKAVVASRADAALQLARELQPAAITLDLALPDADGCALLDQLKHDDRTRHVPVHAVSTDPGDRRLALQLGALAAIAKPATREELRAALDRVLGLASRSSRRVLVAESDPEERRAVGELLGDGEVRVTSVATGEEALAALAQEEFDCVVVDVELPDLPGLELVRRMRSGASAGTPVVVHARRPLTAPEQDELRSIVGEAVRAASTPAQLLEDAALFLHRVEARLPEGKRELLRRAHEADPALDGRTVLVVDDDVRNVFALTSVLERHHMKVLFAESGRGALEMLARRPDLVLLDIMMPEMDGYETIRAMRRTPEGARLPVVALTAKAMKGDRQKCLDAGASDYVAKPVDPDQLLSLLRVWLYDGRAAAAGLRGSARPQA